MYRLSQDVIVKQRGGIYFGLNMKTGTTYEMNESQFDIVSFFKNDYHSKDELLTYLTSIYGTDRAASAGKGLDRRGRPESAHHRTGNQVSRRTGSGERPRNSHGRQQDAAPSCCCLHQHQEHRTAVQDRQATRSL